MPSFNPRAALLAALVVLSIPAAVPAVQAQTATYSEAESARYQALQQRYLTSADDPEQLAVVAAELRDLLDAYPHTIHRKSIFTLLLEAGAASGAPCDTLDALALRILEMGPLHQDFARVAGAYLESGCNLERAEQSAQRAIEVMGIPLADPAMRYYHLLGAVRSARGNHEAARASYEQAFALTNAVLADTKYRGAPPVLSAYHAQRAAFALDLARSYAASGRSDAARVLYETLYTDYPLDESVEQALIQALAGEGRSEAEIQTHLDGLRAQALERIEQEVASRKRNESVAPFALVSTEGDTVRLADQRGKVILLGFWEARCTPCIEQIPALGALKERYAGAPFDILYVNVDDDFAVTPGNVPGGVEVADIAYPSREQALQKVAERYAPPFPLLVGTEDFKNDYERFALPRMLVIDKNGRMQYLHSGYSPHSLILERLALEIEHLLQQPGR